MTENAVSF